MGLLAIWDEDDQWHAPALRAYEELIQSRSPVLTTTFVLAKCGKAASRTPFRSDVDDLRELLEAEGRLVAPTSDDWRLAWSAYRLGEAAFAGIVDHLSFVVMRCLGLDSAFTNDRHFQAAGFWELF